MVVKVGVTAGHEFSHDIPSRKYGNVPYGSFGYKGDVDQVGNRRQSLRQSEAGVGYRETPDRINRLALLVDKLVTGRPCHLKRRLVLCGAVLSIGLVAGCTGGAGATHEPTDKPGRSRSATPTPTLDEKRLGRQAEEALGTETVDDSDPLFVESGLERVSDGIHTESTTTRGKSYELAVVCTGRGKISLSVALKTPVHRVMPCDGVPVSQRMSNAPGGVRIDTGATPGTAGMIAWRITRVTK
ncbi:hypothetical protein ACWCP6_01310 [Streptomyces sp. NPDC002004]